MVGWSVLKTWWRKVLSQFLTDCRETLHTPSTLSSDILHVLFLWFVSQHTDFCVLKPTLALLAMYAFVEQTASSVIECNKLLHDNIIHMYCM